MLFRKNVFLTLVAWMLISVLVSQCKEKGQGAFTVTIDYKNLDKMVQQDGQTVQPPKGGGPTRILLEEIPYGGDLSPVMLDSVTLKGNAGQVTLKGNGKEESIFQVMVEKGPLILVINDENRIQIDLDLSKSENYYSVKGSGASAELKTFIDQYSQRSIGINRAFAAMDSLKQSGAADSMMMVATDNKNRQLSDLNRYLQDYVNNTRHPALGLFAIGWASRSLPTADFEKSLTELTRKFPNHEIIKNLKVTYEQQKAQASQQKSKPMPSSWVGKMAPDISMPTPDGNTVSIASFKGKYLLVDFWASWCGPCRQENPNVVKIFNTFNKKNFTILGVSLDKDKQAWQEAIKADNLAWTHISDLKYWNSKAVELYNIEGIPFNVLIDPQGKIIGESLIGFDLEKKLNEVLQ